METIKVHVSFTYGKTPSREQINLLDRAVYGYDGINKGATDKGYVFTFDNLKMANAFQRDLRTDKRMCDFDASIEY